MKHETWKPIVGCPGYEVSSIGRIKSYRRTKSGRIVKTCVNKEKGYHLVTFQFDGKVFARTLGRVMLEAFVGPAPSQTHQAAHNNGIASDYRIDNLRWATPAENAADKKRHGTKLFGTATNCAKLTERDVVLIRRLSNVGLGAQRIALVFQVDTTTIARILTGKSWSHVK